MAKTTLKHMDELRNKSVHDLLMSGEQFRAELFALKFQAAVGSLEKTHRISELRKEVARIELVLAEKRRAGEDTNKTVKGDYKEAVKAAEKSGKELRQKQREAYEKIQNEQLGGLSDESIAEAMTNVDEEKELTDNGKK